MFHKIGAFFTRLFNSAPSWSQKASTAIKYVAPLTNTLVTLAAGEAEAEEYGRIVSEVQNDLALASAVLSEAHGTSVAPASLNTALEAVNTNLDSLLAAGHVKNPEKVAKIEAIVKTITGEIEAVISSLPKPASGSSVLNPQ